jgi:diguanylate cyclase (GGDEF)-like protein
MADASPRLSWRQALALALTLVVGAGISVSVFLVFRGSESARLLADYTSLASDRAQAIVAGLREEKIELDLLGGYVAASTELSQGLVGPFAEEFGRFAHRIPGLEPESQVLLFIPRVPKVQRAAHEQAAARGIASGYAIWELSPGGEVAAASARDEYFPVEVAEPSEVGAAILGFDLSTVPALRDAVAHAITSGKVTASSRLGIPPTAAEAQYVWQFLAVYRSGAAGRLPASGGELVGLVASAFRIDQLVELALKNLSPAGLDLEITDAHAPPGGELVYYHKSRLPGYEAGGVVKTGLPSTFTIDAGERIWTFRAYPTREFLLRHRSWQSWTMLASGVLLTMVALYVLAGRLRRAARIEALVSTRTQDLASEIAKHERLESDLADSRSTLAAQVDRLNLRNREIQLLNELGDTLQSCVSTDEAYPVLSLFLPRLLPGSSGALYMHDTARDVYATSAEWGAAPPATAVFTAEDCWALRRGRAHAVSASAPALPCRHAPLSREAGSLCIPIAATGKTICLFHVAPCPEEVSTLALSVADRVGLALSNLMLRSDLRELSIHDPLTGLYNRRYMEETLELEIRRAERKRETIGIILLDIDHFKAFNDGYGHGAGDELLHSLGAILVSCLRAGDIACRYGGEEFLLILPEATVDAAARRAEDLRDRVKRLDVRFLDKPLGRITISVGVAAYPGLGRTRDEILAAADRALYHAKEAGRDRVVVAQQPEPPTAG